ncbi:PorT family protein [Hymenobacter aquaticus]|uniref:PorT family protein n=1 Tax=Hymenobacter aquaticus TaxID=1867101 RepID=A0A4Z0Q0H2_9BACT|nr:outer membrane beta-barrel protein [Hymenobacter aquaticus]TGE22252.1 PorT family protein [Hymenobacter aquaticus]
MGKKLRSMYVRIVGLLGIAALLLPATAQAQTGRQPGYVVPLTGDTIRGTVVVNRTQRNAQLCEFEATGQSQLRQYAPAELRGYGAQGISYESQPVRLSANAAPEPVFLEVVTRGVMTLYALQNGLTERFFLAGYRPGKLVELEMRVAMVKRGPREYLAKQRLYQDTLAEAFRACPDQARRGAMAEFRLGELEKVVRSYNLCADPQSAGERTTKRGHLNVGAVLGYNFYSQLSLGTGKNTDAHNQILEGNGYGTGGLELVYTPGFKGAPFTVRASFLYEPSRTFISNRNFYPQETRDNEALLQFSYLTIPAMVRYRVGQHRLRPYAEAGLLLNLLVSMEQDYVTFTYNSTGSVPYTTPLLGEYKSVTFGSGIGGGVEVLLPAGTTLSVGVSARLMQGPDKYEGGSTMKNVGLLVGYTFGQ